MDMKIIGYWESKRQRECNETVQGAEEDKVKIKFIKNREIRGD